MTEPKDTAARDQREARAIDLAEQSATFYKRLRSRGVPATAAQALAEAFVGALVAGELPPEPWQSS